jgi:hypothetical protein
MKLEGVHDGGMPEPAHVVPCRDVALGSLIASQLHEEIRVRVPLGWTTDLDADVRGVMVEEKPAGDCYYHIKSAGY